MDGATGQSYRFNGRRYTQTPTAENPIWLAVADYNRKDIDKAANGTDFKSAAFRVSTSIRPFALLKYTTAYQPTEYLIIGGELSGARYDKGSATKRNPNGFDLLHTGGLENTMLGVRDDFRDWRINLKYAVEDSGDASVPDGRASLISQMVGVGIMDMIENYDIPAALEVIRNTTAIKHVSWAIERDILIPMLEARLVNHWHLMAPDQQAKHTRYIPPAGSTTGSGTEGGGI